MSMVKRRAIVVGVVLVCIFAVVAGRAHSAVSPPTRILTNLKNPAIWQRFGQWLMITEDLPTGRTCYFYDPVVRTKLILKKPAKGTWQPLGSAIKWLMYIDNVNGIDRLMATDVDHQFNSIAAQSAQKQVGCGMSDTRCFYGQYRGSFVDLYCINMLGGGVMPFCISDSEKSQFAHDGKTLVYRAKLSDGRMFIKGISFATGDEFDIAERNGIEPSVCGNLVAWAEADGAAWKIVGTDLNTGEIRTIARTTANPPNPEAGVGAIFWRDSRNASKTGVDIYGYNWQSAKEFPVSTAIGDELKLRVCGDMVTWVTGLVNYQTVWMVRYSP